ncbi:MAG: general secretion pathway protein GspB [Nitrospirae bacterium]|nr:general secretion pathway protein GspB [Nitrospirota bacterium]
MSFILDALKKLEQKRQRGAVPDLMTVHMPESQKPQKRPLWPYLVLVALILNAGILTAWLRPWGTEKKNTPVEFVGEQRTGQDTKSGGQAEKTFSDNHKAAVKGPVSKSNSTEKNREPRIQKPGRSDPLPSPAPASDPGPSDTAKPAAQEDIPELSQLPQAVQAEVSPLAVLGHIYSDSSVTRMVNINGDILREGDTASKNIKVEEITENGVIFNYNGLLFRVRAF